MTLFDAKEGNDKTCSRQVQDKEKDLIELIKYEAKVFTDPEGKKRSSEKGSNKKIYVKALDTIYAALKALE